MKRVLLPLVLLLWIESILAAYYWVHKPWPAGLSLSPILLVVDLSLAGALVALAGGVGRRILRDLSPCSELEGLALQLAIGLGVLGIGTLLVGYFGLLGSLPAWLTLGVGLVLFHREIFDWLVSWRSIVSGYRDYERLERFAVWLVIFLVILCLLQALAPPLKWDSLVYHLELPKRYLAMGKVYFLEDNLFIGQPQLAEMLFMWAMALRSDVTAAAMGWAVGLTALVGVGGFAGRLFGKRARWMAPTILLMGASISQGLSWAYVDLWVLLFGLSATVCLDQYTRSKSIRWALLAGVFAGFALGTKYSAGILIPIGFVVLVLDGNRGRGSRRKTDRPDAAKQNEGMPFPTHERISGNEFQQIVRGLLLFGIIAILVASPWFLKNLVTTGNPVYPFFFGGRGIDELRQAFYAGEAPKRTLADFILLPLQATVFGIEGGPDFNTSVSPLLLALLPGVFLGWRSFTLEQRNSLVNMFVISCTTWILWAVGSQFAVALLRSRHYYASFPALTVLATAGFGIATKIRTPRIRIGWLIRGLVFFVMLLSLIGGVVNFAKANPLRVLLGFESQDDYLADQLGWFGPVMQTINNLPPDSHIAFFWEPRAYYCQVSCSPDVILDRWWHLHRTVGGAAEIASLLRSQGFTHVLIYDLGIQLEREVREVFTQADWEELERFKKEHLLRIESFDEAYTLYAIENTIVQP